jgi:hypothetical protein
MGESISGLLPFLPPKSGQILVITHYFVASWKHSKEISILPRIWFQKNCKKVTLGKKDQSVNHSIYFFTLSNWVSSDFFFLRDLNTPFQSSQNLW